MRIRHKIETTDRYGQGEITLHVYANDIHATAPQEREDRCAAEFAVLSAYQCRRLERMHKHGNLDYVCTECDTMGRPLQGILYIKLT
jgi:ribosomal protein L44E